MGKIVLLDELSINKIAAGEVIERPASVVKEMVENSIDAGATNITVEIKNGGISYIRITDNGKGISEDDLEMAFERHATSKIRNATDLDSVQSMGFRGEALASIAAVANVELVSKPQEQENGYKLVIEGGNIISKQTEGCSNGTSITVSKLFFNTPVRYKFLKKDYTESGYIEDVITRVALSYPNIAIKLINSGKTVIQTNGNGDIKAVIYSIYGKDIAEKIITVDYQYEDIKITGVIGKPEIARSNRSNQIFFVNKRYIKDKILQSATEQAFKGMIPLGKFAFLSLNIDMNPNKVDVNVHPAKLEVRFEEEDKIFKAVYHAIKDSLIKGNFSDNPIYQKEKQDAVKTSFANIASNNTQNNNTKIKMKSTEELLADIMKRAEENTQLKSKIVTERGNNLQNLEKILEENTANSNTNIENSNNENRNIIEEIVKQRESQNESNNEKTNAQEDTLKEKTKATQNALASVEEILASLEKGQKEFTDMVKHNANTQESGQNITQFSQVKDSEVDKVQAQDNVAENVQARHAEDYTADNTQVRNAENYVINNTQARPVEDYETEEAKQINQENQINKANLEEVLEELDEANKQTLAEDEQEFDFEEMYLKTFGRKPQTITNNEEIYIENYNLENSFSGKASKENVSIFENREEFTIPPYKVVGIVFNTYIVIEMNDEMYVIDQHAAHERILYEKVKENYYTNNQENTQLMLLPDVITLSHKEMEIVNENMQMFEKAGFILEEFGENTIKLSGVPDMCIDLDTKELFLETLDEIISLGRTAKQEIEERFIATVACKAAVKANMALDEQEVKALMDKLLKLPNPFTCPHGRPTSIKMTKYEIERKFSRK